MACRSLKPPVTLSSPCPPSGSALLPDPSARLTRVSRLVWAKAEHALSAPWGPEELLSVPFLAPASASLTPAGNRPSRGSQLDPEVL